MTPVDPIAVYGAALSTVTLGLGLGLRFGTWIRVHVDGDWIFVPSLPDPHARIELHRRMVAIRVVNLSARELRVDRVEILGTNPAEEGGSAPWDLPFMGGQKLKFVLDDAQLLDARADQCQHIVVAVTTSDGKVRRKKIVLASDVLTGLRKLRSAYDATSRVI